jgi:outer membrane protein TolC
MRNALDANGKKRTADRAWNSLIPTVNAAAVLSHPTSITGEIPAERDIWSPGFSLSASLNLSLKTIEDIKKAKADYEAGRLSYERAKQDLELQVRKLFYQLVLLEANKELAVQSLVSAQERYEQSAALAKVGQTSHLDELSARVDLENTRPTVRNAEMLYENALDSFKNLLGIDRETTIILKGDLEYKTDISTETMRGESLETAILRKTIESLQAQQKSVRNETYTPSLILSWNAMPLYNYNGDIWNDSSGSFSISLGMNLDNLLPWSQKKTQMDALNDTILYTQIQISETLQNQESRIAQYQRTIEKTKETLEALKLNVELAQTTYTLYEDAYRKGAADYQQLRNAGDSLLQVKNRVQQEQYNLFRPYWIWKRNYLFLLGPYEIFLRRML